MKSSHFFARKEKGQVLVFVVIMLVAMIAMAALLIDGGMKMLIRRQAQAAADAGALAGARQYCQHGDGDSTEVKDTAESYAYSNYATEANATIDGNLVTVDTSVSRSPVFAGVFSNNDLESSATATAGCFTPHEVDTIFPLTWKCDEANGSSDYADCKVRELPYATTDWPPSSSSTSHLYIFLVGGSNDGQYNDYSGNWHDNPAYSCSGGLLTCNLENAGTLVGADAGSLLCPGGGCNQNNVAANLKVWVSSGVSLSSGDFEVGSSISGYPNNIPPLKLTTVYGSVQKNEYFLLPVFKGSATGPYRISGFATFYITCASSTLKNSSCPGANSAYNFNNTNKSILKDTSGGFQGGAIEGYFVSDYPLWDLNQPNAEVNVGVNWVSLTP